jgi:hypothetical protein
MHSIKDGCVSVALAFSGGGAYFQWALFGFPVITPDAQPSAAGELQGFPSWLRITRCIEFLSLTLIGIGLQILIDRPRV